jgi:mRNA-degrading endonuclease toxin of MazEF toxin-antitoxin module
VPKAERFDAIVLSGHKGLAFEVPFDPGKRWGVAPVALQPGRRGVLVRGTVDGKAFESAAVSRMRRYFVLVTDEMARAARLREGSSVTVSLRPRD